jgi:hypothetical protein
VVVRQVPYRTRAAGRELRYRLCLLVRDAGRPVSVNELVEWLDESGLTVGGRTSKTVSDALRWEIAHGRVVRVGRSMYAPGAIPPSTLWSIRRWLERRSGLSL